MIPIDEDESPLKQGLVMFFSFLAFGCIPLLRMWSVIAIDVLMPYFVRTL